MYRQCCDQKVRDGILVFVNNALISWLLKRQNTVECSTFGSEFCDVAYHSGAAGGAQVQHVENVWSAD